MHKKLGVLMMALGLAMLAGAAGLILHNRTEQANADASAQVALDQIRVVMAQAEEPAEDEMLPEEMPVMLIDGEEYIGYLEMPTIGVTLPVMKDWSYPKLRVAPCRYSGSPQDGAMVIMAHNYERHFGQIKDLPIGADVADLPLCGGRARHAGQVRRGGNAFRRLGSDAVHLHVRRREPRDRTAEIRADILMGSHVPVRSVGFSVVSISCQNSWNIYIKDVGNCRI